MWKIMFIRVRVFITGRISDGDFWCIAMVDVLVGEVHTLPRTPTSASLIFSIGDITSAQMKIYLTDQTENFEGLLKQLTTKPTMTFDKTKLKEKTTTIDIRTEKTLGQLNLDFLFDYKIFPSKIMKFMTEWGKENRKMKIGDTILQQAFLPPIKTFSQKIVFGVRINKIIDETDRKGFSYVTIKGHVEKGESTFTIEQSENGLIFKIKTFSEPGNLLTKLVGPIFTVPYQTYSTRKALGNVKRQLEQ